MGQGVVQSSASPTTVSGRRGERHVAIIDRLLLLLSTNHGELVSCYPEGVCERMEESGTAYSRYLGSSRASQNVLSPSHTTDTVESMIQF